MACVSLSVSPEGQFSVMSNCLGILRLDKVRQSFQITFSKRVEEWGEARPVFVECERKPLTHWTQIRQGKYNTPSSIIV